MSKNKKTNNPNNKLVANAASNSNAIKNTTTITANKDTLIVNKPILWLIAATLIVYVPVIYFKFTELDDSIFIKEFHEYYQDISNFFTSFHRGLFDAVKDPYYRPLFLNSMLLNYQLFHENIEGYHFINILFHITSVILLYKLFIKLDQTSLNSFILTLIFAVHPVLCQAVAWIPGRNDTLLAIFTLSFLIFSINFTKTGKIHHLLLSILFLLLAFFTKETAIFAAPVALTMLVLMLKNKIYNIKILIQMVLWAGCLGVWYYARSQATIATTAIVPGQLAIDFFNRLPVIIQYIGKIFLPFNLSVFPTKEDTTYLFGIIATILLIVSIIYYKKRNWRILLSGLIVFFFFLTPALLVPNHLNDQTFEHRLYLPIIGILILLPQTCLLNTPRGDWQLMLYGITVCVILGILNYIHQRNFADPQSFWRQAVQTSPNCAYANMMLAERDDNMDESVTLFKKAYHLNPKEKYINFYYAEMLIKTNNKDSLAAAEKYLLAERNISNYIKCYFYLAQIAVMKNDFPNAISYLKTFLKTVPETSDEGKEANNNLMIIYYNTHQTNELILQINHMKQLNIPVPIEILKNIPQK